MNQSIKVIPFPDIENAYVVISACYYQDRDRVEKNMSFFYGGEKVGAEWEPNYGPITVIYSCDKDYVPESSFDKVQEHWFYDYCTGYGYWSQLAVEDEGLKQMFLRGNYDGIFAVLKRWAEQ